MDNYERLIDRISESSNVDKEELERKVEAKRAKLSGLVSREGAAQIVAAELGINFDQERLKIGEINEGMRRANIVGKVVEKYPVREFNKNGREGKVANLLVADETSNARVVLWDVNHIALIENGEIEKGDVIEVSNANVRNGELHLGSFSNLKKSDEKVENVQLEKSYSNKRFSDSKAGDSLKSRAVIVQSFEPRYFEVCPECKKRVVEGECATHGKVNGEKRALLNIVLDDGSETMRCVIFGDQIKNLGLNDEEIFSLEKFESKKQGLLGKEMLFSGNVRSNALYNVIEMSIDGIAEVDADELIKELEAKA